MTSRNIPVPAGSPEPPVPPLRHGDRLTQAEFHRRYERYPEGAYFELIGGVVRRASRRVSIDHGSLVAEICGILGLYKAATPGLRAAMRASTILDDTAEVHPDLSVSVEPVLGGQTWDEGNYIGGAPELIVEVSDETLKLDLTDKKEDYHRAGVLEYLVWDIAGRRL